MEAKNGWLTMESDETTLRNSRFGFVIDSLEAVVYVADMESHEILMVNKRAREIIGDRIGEKCWQVLQKDQAGPCAFCTNKKLVSSEGISSGIAHDLNNSLQIILGNAELALFAPNVPAGVVKNLEMIKNLASKTAETVQLLQSVSTKEQLTEANLINLNDLLDEVILKKRPLWKDMKEKKGFHFSFQKYYRTVRKVRGNLSEISSVLSHLLKNAVEAMPKGGRIIFETGETEENVYFRITDSGVGMDEKTKKRIFQPFFSTKGFSLGKGFGLSRAFSVMEKHGGAISVKETAPGEGTTFELLFPFVKESESADAVSSEGRLRVLWVDDEELLRVLGKQLLEHLDCSVDMAESGKEALSLLERNQYDLFITDIGMPEMNGLQLLEVVKGQYPNMKKSIISGWAINGEEKENLEVDFVLTKPVSLGGLRELIETALRSKN